MHTCIYPSTHLSPNPPIYLSTHSIAHRSISSFIQPANHSSIHPCFYPLFHPSTLLSPHPPTYLSIHSFSHPTISSFIQPAKCPASCSSIHPSTHLSPKSPISKITTDGDYSHEIKRRLLCGRKAITNLESILKGETSLGQQRSV